jgi:pyruvate/2-oxoglutarate dehydrogenase complex dihydrolipoamide dehydrogenase (E3) component
MSAGTLHEHEFDVVVIGAGPVGENVADRVVQGGLTAAVVEAELVGGECSYWACMPTKALLRDAAALEATKRLPAAAAAVTGALDPATVFARRDRFASDWHDDGQVSWLERADIALVRGHGRISGLREVTVTDRSGGATRVLRARHAVVVATGTRAAVPAIPGLAEARPWTSREAVSAHRVPDRLAVIGGGVVGVEMATAYRALGAEVTLLARDGVLPNVEPFASEHVVASLTTRGVDVRVGASPERVDRGDDGSVRIGLGGGDLLFADEVLVATGRTPNTDDLGLDTVGLPAGWLRVDETLRVVGDDDAPIDWLYAAGDVNRRALLTHQGKYQARATGDVIVARATGAEIADTAWGRHAATADLVAVPQVVFTAPEIAAVGRSVAAAERAGLLVRSVEVDLGAVAGAALHADGYTGRANVVVDEDTQTVVGFTAVGPDVAEMLHAATIAIVGQVPIDRLWHAVPAYPTISEAWLRLLEALGR